MGSIMAKLQINLKIHLPYNTATSQKLNKRNENISSFLAFQLKSFQNLGSLMVWDIDYLG